MHAITMVIQLIHRKYMRQARLEEDNCELKIRGRNKGLRNANDRK